LIFIKHGKRLPTTSVGKANKIRLAKEGLRVTKMNGSFSDEGHF